MPNTSKHNHLNVPSSANLSDEEYVKSAEFLEAMAAACAMIAWSDGKISPEERRQFFVSARTHSLLSIFSAAEVLGEFAMHEKCFERDRNAALMLVEDKLKPVVGHPEIAKSLLNECRKMILADGFAYPSEFGALHKIKEILGLKGTPGSAAFGASQTHVIELKTDG